MAVDKQALLEELQQLNAELAELERVQRECKIIGYKPIGNQSQFHHSTAAVRVVFGSNRSGKSVAGFAELQAHALGYRPWLPEDHPNRIVRLADGKPIPVPNRGYHLIENLKVAGTQVFIPKFEEWVPKGMAKIKKNNLGQPVQVDWANGSTTYVLSQEMGVSAVEGSNGHYLSVDEPPREDFWVALTRGLIDFAGVAWITATPIKSSVFMAELMTKCLQDNNDYELISLSIDDNRRSRGGYLDDDAVDRFIASLPAHEIEARVHGRPAHLSGAVYPKWRPAPPYFIKPFEIPLTWPRIMVVDPAGQKPMAAVWMALSPKGKWIVYRELYRRDLNTVAKISDEIKLSEGWERTANGKMVQTWESEPIAFRLIDTSGQIHEMTSGGSVAFEFRRHGLSFMNANKQSYMAGVNRIREMLDFDPTSEFSNSSPELLVFNTCMRVAHEFMNFVWLPESAQSRSTGRDAVDKPLKTNDDCLDCIRYAIMSNATYSGLLHTLRMAGKEI